MIAKSMLPKPSVTESDIRQWNDEKLSSNNDITVNITGGMGDFILKIRNSIPELPYDEQGNAEVDCNNNSESLLAISAFLGKLLPKMDRTVVRLSEIQFETLSSVNDLIGEDFISDFMERCDEMSESINVIRGKFAELKHDYLIDTGNGVISDMNVCFTKINNVCSEWCNKMVNKKFKNIGKKGLSMSDLSNDISKYQEKFPEESYIWGVSSMSYAHSCTERFKAVLNRSGSDTSLDKVMAPLEYGSKWAMTCISDLSRNAQCYLMPGKDGLSYVEKAYCDIKRTRLLSRDITSVLFAFRQLDRQLGLHLVDDAYEVVGSDVVGKES